MWSWQEKEWPNFTWDSARPVRAEQIFAGRLSAANYMSITGATSATTTRDLQDLVKKSALRRVGLRKSTRSYLAMDIMPVDTVTVDDIL